MKQDLRPTSGLDRAQGILSASAFVLLLMGTNTPTPLLPLYRDQLGFSPLVLTLTYSTYVSALVVVLFIASSPAIVRRAPMMLLSSLLVAILADTLLATGMQQGVLTGRVLAGISGGIGTGAAAALTVSVFGEKGRALSVTGNLGGAILGTSLCQLIVFLTGVRAVSLSFEIHLTMCLVLLVPLFGVLFARRKSNTAIFAYSDSHKSSVLPVLSQFRWALFTGCLAWILISCCIVFLPSYFADHTMPLVQAFGIPLMLTGSLGGQLFSPRLRQVAGFLSGMWCMLIGIGLIFGGAWLTVRIASLPGFCLVGFGAGLAYRSSLMLLVLRVSPVTQGRISSLYAAITYGVAAVAIVLSGFLTRVADMSTVADYAFVSLFVLILVLNRRAPKLSDLD